MLEASASQIILWAIAALVTILITIVGWLGRKIFEKLNSIDENEKKQSVEIAEIRKDTHSTSETVKELKQSMSKISGEVVDLRIKVVELENRIKNLEDA